MHTQPAKTKAPREDSDSYPDDSPRLATRTAVLDAQLRPTNNTLTEHKRNETAPEDDGSNKSEA